ncbi:MAG: hypothetical protein C3F06_10130 [Candidatus Methanoperedenaceae archaeon]|nr:MAG: hypothetical protein C3F06_10130 [Candidatus Methanoperedenaceae archaeon]
MNLIEKLFGKKEKSFGSITQDMLPEWLESRSRNISEKLEKDASSLYPEIEKTLRKIRESTSRLEKAQPEGRYHLKLVKVASSNRDNMAKQVRMLLENVTIPGDKSIKAILAFHQSADQTLGVCLENMMKSYQYTKLVFFEESKNVISEVNSLGRLLNEIIEPINSKKEVLDALENSREMIMAIRKNTLDLESIERSIKENEEKSVFLKKEIDEKQNAINLLLDSESWKQYTISKNDLILLETKAENKISEIKSIISPLNKALNRLKQLNESGRHALKPEDKEGLNLSLTCPIDVPPEFFVEFQKIVESGVLNLPKPEKFLPQIRFAASSLGESRKEYQDILHDIDLKKDEISKMKIIKDEKNLKDMLSDLQEKLMMTEKELDSSKNQLELLRREIESNNVKLREYVSVIDSRVRIS